MSYHACSTANEISLHSTEITIMYSEVLTWGAGKFGQLGNSHYEDSVQLQNILQLIPSESGKPVQVSAGCGHTGFVTEKGHAYTCGDNRYNQLGKLRLLNSLYY